MLARRHIVVKMFSTVNLIVLESAQFSPARHYINYMQIPIHSYRTREHRSSEQHAQMKFVATARSRFEEDTPFTERKIDFSDIEFSFAFRFESIFNCGRYSSLFLFPYHHHHPSLSSRRICLSGVSHAAFSTVTVAHGLK